MTCKNKEFKKPLSDFDKEFICLQIEKAIESYRSAVSLMAKVITVLLIINITLLGYSIVTKVSGIMFIGSLFPIMILYTAYESIKFSIPIVYTAVNLENKYGLSDTDWLASTFLSFSASSEILEKLKSISYVKDSKVRIKQLHDITRQVIKKTMNFPIFMIILTIIQLFLPIVLTSFFGWRLF